MPFSFPTEAARVQIRDNWLPVQDILKVSMAPGEVSGEPEMQRWSPGQDSFCQEPIFVPRPQSSAEDDGWLLAPIFRSATATTDLAILDAQDLRKGPLATIRLPHHIPIGAQTFPFLSSQALLMLSWRKLNGTSVTAMHPCPELPICAAVLVRLVIARDLEGMQQGIILPC